MEGQRRVNVLPRDTGKDWFPMPSNDICTISDCTNRLKARGMCNAHYLRLWARGSLDLPTTPTDAERFWGKVHKTATCWEWRGAIDARGYGAFRFGGKAVKAHRWAYEHCVGPIPDGLQLDHLCRVRSCVNPAHLEPVTRQENIRRGEGGLFMLSKTHCPYGHPYDAVNTRIYHGRRFCRACGSKKRTA